MWGFVSVMLALLFLLMPSTVVDGKGPFPDLFGARHSTRMPGAGREDVMRIDLTRDGRVFFRSVQVTREDLPDVIRKGLHEGAERKVYLAVDARTRYSDVPPILDEIRLAGVDNVAFLTW
jgi:biopolymer transport protein ExbD